MQSIANPNFQAVDTQAISTVSGVEEYLAAAIAANTRRAYQGDLHDFCSWGGSLPSTPQLLAEYIVSRASLHSPITIARRLVGIGRAHTSLGLEDPSKSDLVRSVLRGLRRMKGGAQRQAVPILRDDLFPMLGNMRGVCGARDKAILLLGFAAALRRAELVSLDTSDLRILPEGLLVHLRRSKTDQEQEGVKIAVPFGRTAACPVNATLEWMEMANIGSGALFRAVNKSGVVSGKRLSSQSVSLIVKKRVAELGLDSQRYSGHSLRAGLITCAAKAGVSFSKIQQQTRHRSVAMLSRYIRDAKIFEDNAAGVLL